MTHISANPTQSVCTGTKGLDHQLKNSKNAGSLEKSFEKWKIINFPDISCRCRNIAKMSTWSLDREGEKRWRWNCSIGQSSEDPPPKETMRQSWMSTFKSSKSFVTKTLRS